MIHPDTQEVIPFYSRFNGFALFNLPIGLCIFALPQTTLNIVLVQFMNQTYNAAVNYGNRNASSTYTNSDLAQA